MKNKVLIVAAHPDDEVLGCGGTVAALAGINEVYLLTLGRGIAARFDNEKPGKKSRDLKKIKMSFDKAAGILGFKKTFIFDFPDNRFDTAALLDIIKTVEKVKNEIKPDTVYTHYHSDLNIDHRVTYSAVLTACRPLKGETVRDIYSFEVPSSTDWNYPHVFSPNMFIDITGTIDKKIEALKCYETELKGCHILRTEESIRCIAKRWGAISGLRCAEAFEAVRIIR